MRLGEVTEYLDDYLRVREVPDAPQALNGLQLANGGEITRVAAAVDLCEATVRLAAEARADLLLVHHGLFWGGPRPLTGPAYRRRAGRVRRGVRRHDRRLGGARRGAGAAAGATPRVARVGAAPDGVRPGAHRARRHRDGRRGVTDRPGCGGGIGYLYHK